MNLWDEMTADAMKELEEHEEEIETKDFYTRAEVDALIRSAVKEVVHKEPEEQEEQEPEEQEEQKIEE